MATRRSALPWVVGTAVAAVAACSVDTGSFEGKTCTSVVDCPIGYACVSARLGTPTTCEILYPNLQPAITQTNLTPDYYCTDIKPMFDVYCVNCHVVPVPPSPPGIPTWFRLDQYGDQVDAGFYPDGGAKIEGAFSRAADSNSRVNIIGNMPQIGFPQPSAAQKQQLANWVAAGAPLCDAGPVVDAGTDAGVDAGPSLSFAVTIQPIFDTNCIGCHAGATPAAGMDLSTAHSWMNLVNVTCKCDAGFVRVKPSDTMNSMLWLKTSNAATECGVSMPKGQTPLNQASPAQFQQITRWIQQGALNN